MFSYCKSRLLGCGLKSNISTRQKNKYDRKFLTAATNFRQTDMSIIDKSLVVENFLQSIANLSSHEKQKKRNFDRVLKVS